jgi:hypothetical protein
VIARQHGAEVAHRLRTPALDGQAAGLDVGGVGRVEDRHDRRVVERRLLRRARRGRLGRRRRGRGRGGGVAVPLVVGAVGLRLAGQEDEGRERGAGEG